MIININQHKPFSSKNKFFSTMNHFIKVKDFAPIINRCLQLNNQSMVIFDVEDVLIRPSSYLSRIKNYAFCRKKIGQHLHELPADKEKMKDYYQTLIDLHSKDEVIDERSVHLVQDLHSRKIKTIASISLSGDSLSPASDALTWRIKERLKHKQFDFSSEPLSNHCNVQTKNFLKTKKLRFSSGVLISSIPQGNALKMFFNKTQCVPSEIVVVGTQVENLKSVADKMRTLRIKSHLFHYETNQSDDDEVNYTNLQICRLIRTGDWINDKDASALTNI